MNKPLSGREAYYKEVTRIEKKEPFTAIEKKRYNNSQREFIRAIQVTRGMKKREAIRHYKKNVTGKKAGIKREAELFKRRYTGRVDFRRKATLKKEVDRGYRYAGIVKEAPKSLKDRFVPDYSTPARKYTDTVTGEVISRRERDKRIGAEITE